MFQDAVSQTRHTASSQPHRPRACHTACKELSFTKPPMAQGSILIPDGEDIYFHSSQRRGQLQPQYEWVTHGMNTHHRGLVWGTAWGSRGRRGMEQPPCKSPLGWGSHEAYCPTSPCRSSFSSSGEFAVGKRADQ